MIKAFVGQYVDYDRFEREEAAFGSAEEARGWFEAEAARVLAEKADDCTRRERGDRVAFVEVREDGGDEDVLLYADMPCSAMDEVDDAWAASNNPDHSGRVCVSMSPGRGQEGPRWYESRRDIAEAYARCYASRYFRGADLWVWEYSDDETALFSWTDPQDGRRMVHRFEGSWY